MNLREWQKLEAQQWAIVKGEVIVDTWCIDDVEQQAKQMDITLTYKQKIDVLGLVLSNHDANYGINWETISDAIEEVQREEPDPKISSFEKEEV